LWLIFTTTLAYAQAPESATSAIVKRPIAFRSGDLALLGYLFKPEGTGPFPALVWNHGSERAPGRGQQFDTVAGIFTRAGYVVFAPNPRGSTGFGQEFTDQISGDWGGRVFEDIMKGVNYLTGLPYVDPGRVAAAGASYGGYMINWIQGHSDRFRALVSHDGVYNTVSMYGATEELWFPEWEFHGPPWENPGLYARMSPSTHVKRFKTPMLIIHGELDFRVPIGEGLQLFTALQRMNVPSKFLYFPDEGHWVLKPQNSELWYTTVLDWIDRYTK